MDCKIVEQDAFWVVGKALKVSTIGGENFRKIPQFWMECNQDGTCEKLAAGFHAREMLGVMADMDEEKQELTYMIAVKGGKAYRGKEYAILKISAATWAIFTSIGPIPGAIQKVCENIFRKWFPAAGYEHAPAPELEVYPLGDMNAADYKCEVWIPVIKK